MSRRTRRVVTLLVAIFFLGCRAKTERPELAHLGMPAVPTLAPKEKRLEPAPLTEALRVKGFSECNPYDPLGLGPYALYRPLYMGRMLIPQKGGHTADMGYDVLIHFHGSVAARKHLVQVTRGLVLVLVDKGNGGGPYAKALQSPMTFPELRRSIQAELVRKSGDARAHIRHLGVSAWSAGEVAIDKLLEQRQPGIDAYVILDGLPVGWKPGALT